ncbi:MAG: class I SAM-dependent methyltransferase [Labilithrix sp.]|nr:class I SAM-dependent methyltransferase [Labilithrix sp.]MBX3212358.1 class I SAM-dependent methyltransferase [Labilithrix sp.]
MSTTIATCRACGGKELAPVLSLGKTPLANALLAADDLAKPESTFPLELVFCPSCTLVQITEEVPPETMFGEYLYFSSFSDTMVKHAETIAARLTKDQGLGPKSLVVEVASNDGYLLQHYAKAGVPVLGVEPARNIAKVAEEKGIRTLCRFFGRELAEELRAKGERADVIHANNVLAHVPDLEGVVAGFGALLKDEAPGQRAGVAVVEAPYVRDLVDHCEFDTIYHEHLCYFSLTALDRLTARHGLVIHDVERLAIHGGSLRIFFSKAGAYERSERVTALLGEEKASGVDTLAFYAGFANRVNGLKTELVSVLRDLKAKGARIAAYGAAAKGATLVNFFGIGADLVDFVVDRSTYKQGRYMPGARIPILPPAALVEKKPDYCLLLAWNFADEILAQQKDYRDGGGKFIVPIPNVRIA